MNQSLFNTVTDWTKFNYLSSNALGTADITNTDYFDVTIVDEQYYPWDTGIYKTIYLHKIKKAKAMVVTTNGVILPDGLPEEIDFGGNLILRGSLNYTFINQFYPNLRIVSGIVVEGSTYGSLIFYSTNIVTLKDIKLKGEVKGILQESSEITNLINIDCSEANYLDILQYESRPLYTYDKLVKIDLRHVRTSGLNFTKATSIPKEEFVRFFKEGLDKVTTSQTLTLGTTNLAKLTEEDKKIATDKGWTLA